VYAERSSTVLAVSYTSVNLYGILRPLPPSLAIPQLQK
jgi:hypothetical protein